MVLLPPSKPLLVQDPNVPFDLVDDDTLATLSHAAAVLHRSAFFFQTHLNVQLSQIDQAKISVRKFETSLADRPKWTQEDETKISELEAQCDTVRRAKEIARDPGQRRELARQLVQLQDQHSLAVERKDNERHLRMAPEIKDSLDCAAEVVQRLAALPILPLPSIPDDIGRVIIELLAASSFKEAQMLSVVCKKMQLWADPVMFYSIGDHQRLKALLPAFAGNPGWTSQRMLQVRHYVVSVSFRHLSGAPRLQEVALLCPNIQILAIHATMTDKMKWPATSYVHCQGNNFPKLSKFAGNPGFFYLPPGTIHGSFTHPIFHSLTHLLLGAVYGSPDAYSSWNWSSLRFMTVLRNIGFRIDNLNGSEEERWSPILRTILDCRPVTLKALLLWVPRIAERFLPPVVREFSTGRFDRLVVYSTPTPEVVADYPPGMLFISQAMLMKEWDSALWDKVYALIDSRST